MRNNPVTTAGLVTLAASLLFATPASAAGLTPHSAVYKVKISVASGRLNTELAATDDGFEANHRIEPTGLAGLFRQGSIEETSVFATTSNGVRPIRYRSSDTLTKEKTQADVRFDWSTGEITGTVNDADFHDRTAELAHDRVSIQYELMHNLLNGGADSRYVLFDIDEFKTLNVSLLGTREIRTPAGRFEAIGIQHQAAGSSRVTTLWCVEELDYLPVVIEQHRKGKLRLKASLLEYSPAAP